MKSDTPFFLVSGPCVIEDEAVTLRIAERLKTLTERLGIPFTFKASYDKANRTAITSFRGPGMTDGLRVLAKVKETLDVPVLSDVHRISEVSAAAEVLDVIQIPAFLCRQTDLILSVARTGKPVNVKKGQFLAPWDMVNIIEKIRSVSSVQSMITERGVMFGYNNLVVDFRGSGSCNRQAARWSLTPPTASSCPAVREPVPAASGSLPRCWHEPPLQPAPTVFSWRSTKTRTRPFATVPTHSRWMNCPACWSSSKPLKPRWPPDIIP